MSSEGKVEGHSDVERKADEAVNSDEQQLNDLGYKQQLHRSLSGLESFISSFCSVNFIASVRAVFFLGILAGGPLAMWTSEVITVICMSITALVLAEICSALPISGSIYIWAAVAAGPKYGRFFGFIVAWWIAATWVTFSAITCQGTANYLLSLVPVYGLEFPGGISNDNVKWRSVVWIVSQLCLILSVINNYLPPRIYSIVSRVAMGLMLLDFALCLIWLPIGASRTYGLRTAKEAFLVTYNGTGASPRWNWMLSFLFAASTISGFDGAGHVAEETKDASTVAARSIFRSAVASGLGGLVTTILFLFCTPAIDTLFSLNAPQPFVIIYSMALGRGGSVVMTVLAALAAILTNSVIIQVASRLIFAIARDGALPFSSWVGKTTLDGRPKNAVTVMYGFCAALLCTILPSASAFTSLMSGGLLPLAASYGLIALLRLTLTPNGFKSTRFSLGPARKLLYAVTAIFNAVVFAAVVSPFTFPVTASSLNFSGIIFGAVTIFGLLSYWFIPEGKWLGREQIQQMYDGANQIPVPDGTK